VSHVFARVHLTNFVKDCDYVYVGGRASVPSISFIHGLLFVNRPSF
jgi:hypothetical protein